MNMSSLGFHHRGMRPVQRGAAVRVSLPLISCHVGSGRMKSAHRVLGFPFQTSRLDLYEVPIRRPCFLSRLCPSCQLITCDRPHRLSSLSNYVQIISIFALGAALTNVFGRMVGSQREGWPCLPSWEFYSSPPSSPVIAQCPRAHRRQRDAFRHRRFLALRGDHHRGIMRRGQRHA